MAGFDHGGVLNCILIGEKNGAEVSANMRRPKTLDHMDYNYSEEVERMLSNGSLLPILRRLEQQANPY